MTTIKPYADCKSHFIARLYERHRIKISEAKYDSICEAIKSNANGAGHLGPFIPIFSRGNKLFGKMQFHTHEVGKDPGTTRMVHVMWSKNSKCLATAYPDCENNLTSLILSAFGPSIRDVIFIMADKYLKEKEKISKKKFKNVRKASMYYFKKTVFASIHTSMFTGKYKIIKGTPFSENEMFIYVANQILNKNNPIQITLKRDEKFYGKKKQARKLSRLKIEIDNEKI